MTMSEIKDNKFDENIMNEEELNIDDMGIRDGLNASFDIDDICVSEDLIARTMSAIKAAGNTDKAKWIEAEQDSKSEEAELNNEAEEAEQAKKNSEGKIVRFNWSRFAKIAGSIAAVLVLGVIGISVLGRLGVGEMKSDTTSDPKSEASNYIAADTASTEAYSMSEEPASVEADDEMEAKYEDDILMPADGNSYMDDSAFTKCEDGLNKSAMSDMAEEEPATASDAGESLENEVDGETYIALAAYLESVSTGTIFNHAGFLTVEEAELLEGDILFEVSYYGPEFWQWNNLTVYEDRYYISYSPMISSNSMDYKVAMYNLEDIDTVISELEGIVSAK